MDSVGLTLIGADSRLIAEMGVVDRVVMPADDFTPEQRTRMLLMLGNMLEQTLSFSQRLAVLSEHFTAKDNGHTIDPALIATLQATAHELQNLRARIEQGLYTPTPEEVLEITKIYDELVNNADIIPRPGYGTQLIHALRAYPTGLSVPVVNGMRSGAAGLHQVSNRWAHFSGANRKISFAPGDWALYHQADAIEQVVRGWVADNRHPEMQESILFDQLPYATGVGTAIFSPVILRLAIHLWRARAAAQVVQAGYILGAGGLTLTGGWGWVIVGVLTAIIGAGAWSGGDYEQARASGASVDAALRIHNESAVYGAVQALPVAREGRRWAHERKTESPLLKPPNLAFPLMVPRVPTKTPEASPVPDKFVRLNSP